MQTASKKLMSGTVIYMVGSLSSKLLQLLILPILTGILLTDEYGYYDLIVSSFSLVLPIVTLKAIDAVFRFLFHADDEKKKRIISSVTMLLSAGCIIAVTVFLLASHFFDGIQYSLLIIGHFVTYVFFDYAQKVSRSFGLNKEFAISGVLHTVLLLATELLTLLVFKLRVDGLLVSNIIANTGVILFLNTKIHFGKWIRFRYIDKSSIVEMLKFSSPLIPNSICWWFVSACNKYIIAFSLGASFNGLYSVANKFPQIVSFATSVFQLAWQESAITESDSKQRNVFYSSVFNQYLRLLGSALPVGLMAIKIIMPFMIDPSYYDSIRYVPALMIGVITSAFAQFYGTAYIVSKKTTGAMVTTIVSAVVNVVFCIATINYIGLFAPAIATALAFLVQWIYRAYQMRDYFVVTINKKLLPLLSFMAIVFITLYYIPCGIVMNCMFLICAAAAAFMICFEMIKAFFQTIKKFATRK